MRTTQLVFVCCVFMASAADKCDGGESSCSEDDAALLQGGMQLGVLSDEAADAADAAGTASAPLVITEVTFTLPNTPIEDISRKVASITQSQWPESFCINMDVTPPAQQSNYQDLGLIGGQDDVCEGIYLPWRAGNKIGFGVQCNARGSDGGLDVPEAPASERHLFSFCYSVTTKKASIYVDNTHAVTAQKIWNFDRFGSISIFSGLHSKDLDTTEGATLHSLTLSEWTKATFVLPDTPIAAISRAVASITEAQWPEEFCINMDVTTPPSDTGELALIGGREDVCEGIYILWRATNKIGFGVQCNAGSSDGAFQVPEAYDTIVGNGARHLFGFCYSVTSKQASIYVDGNEAATAEKTFNFDRSGAISIFSGLHSKNQDTATGATLHSLKLSEGLTPLKSACTSNKFLLQVDGSATNSICLADCPPGYTNVPGPVASPGVAATAGSCKLCLGKKTSATTCVPCPAGHISKEDSDDCQNIQDTCELNQCKTCVECLGGIKYSSCFVAGSCYNPGGMWCPGASEGLFQCQSSSVGCWHKMLCSVSCVCTGWKDIFCGGKTEDNACSTFLLEGIRLAQQNRSVAEETSPPVYGNDHASAALKMRSSGKSAGLSMSTRDAASDTTDRDNKSKANDEEGSLDESLTLKKTC